MKENWPVVIAIVDDGANLMYLERMDGVQVGSIVIAQEKAVGILSLYVLTFLTVDRYSIQETDQSYGRTRHQ